MSLESEVNAVYRPFLEASTSIEQAQGTADSWLEAAQSYAERAGWTKAQVDRLTQDMNNYLAPRLRDIEAHGRTLTQEEKWDTYAAPDPSSPSFMAPASSKTAGTVLLAGGAIAAAFGLGWLALNIFTRR